MIDRQNFFDQPVKNDLRIHDNIRHIAIGQGGDYISGCLIAYTYFNNYYKLIAIDLKNNKHLMLIQKQHNKLILQEPSTRFIANTTILSITEEAKETVLDFSQGTVKVL